MKDQQEEEERKVREEEEKKMKEDGWFLFFNFQFIFHVVNVSGRCKSEP